MRKTDRLPLVARNRSSAIGDQKADLIVVRQRRPTLRSQVFRAVVANRVDYSDLVDRLSEPRQR